LLLGCAPAADTSVKRSLGGEMSKTRLAALLAVTLLALVGSTAVAGASMMRFEPGGTVRLTGWFASQMEGVTIRCNVTLTATVTSTLVTVARETVIGSLTEGASESCSGATTINILHPRAIVNPVILITPEGTVVGVLARIENFGILVERVLGISSCLYGSEIGLLIGSEERATRVELLEETSLLLVRTLSGFCPLAAPWSAELTMSPGQRVIYLP
jgi:hypothetical protein